MKLGRAIRVNEDNRDFFEAHGFDDCAEALQLGIEALKRIQRQRKSLEPNEVQLLPGETKK